MEKMKEKLGIFILNHNGIKWLEKNLNNIIEHSQNNKIIIIDNNSNDNSVEYIRSNFPQISIKFNYKNYGFSKGYNNILLKEFNFEYFILLNNDVVLTKDWLNPMLDLIKKDEISIIQPKILNLLNKKQFDYAGAAGGFIDITGIPFCRGRILNKIETDYGQYNTNMNIFWASGCCFMIKSELFQKLNGFDEDFFMHQEEIDLCWRAQAMNKKIYYCSESTVYHHGGGTLESSNPIKHFYNHRNSLLLLFKNLPIHLLFTVFPIRLMIDYLIVIYYFMTGLFYFIFTSPLYFQKDYIPSKKKGIRKIQTSILILIAHMSFLLLFRKFTKKRSPINAKNIYPRSIIFDYYLMKKKKFSDLKKF